MATPSPALVGLAQFGNLLGKSANVLTNSVGLGSPVDPQLGVNTINNGISALKSAQQASQSTSTPSYAQQQATAQAAAQAAQNASQAAAYDSQAGQYQSQLGQLDPSQATALSNLQNQYNGQYNTAQDQFAKAQRDYNTSVANNTNSFLGTKDSILNNTRANANALQRLLGLNGAGNSSAALEQAPYAAALQGTQNLNGAQQTYAQNQAGLDTNFSDTKDNYKKTLDDLQQQLYQNQNATKASIAQQRASLLNNLSQAKINAAVTRGASYDTAKAQNNYDGQINDLLSQITGYGNNYASPIALKNNVTYTAPTAQSYSLGQQAVASNGQSGATGDISPTFLNLLTGRRDQYGNPLAA